MFETAIQLSILFTCLSAPKEGNERQSAARRTNEGSEGPANQGHTTEHNPTRHGANPEATTNPADREEEADATNSHQEKGTPKKLDESQKANRGTHEGPRNRRREHRRPRNKKPQSPRGAKSQGRVHTSDPIQQEQATLSIQHAEPRDRNRKTPL